MLKAKIEQIDNDFKSKGDQVDDEFKELVTKSSTILQILDKLQHHEKGRRFVIDSRFNQLAYWDNPKGDRFSIDLDIISVEMDMDGSGSIFPIIEILKTTLVDQKNNERIEGIVGNNSRTYKEHFSKPPVICLSVSDSKTYYQTPNHHPVLGVEHLPNETSLTEQYFKKMGLQVRYFMPSGSLAPLAFYFTGDLLRGYTNLELISTISTMESFQKIYRPEIYNANSAAGQCFEPSLQHKDYSLTRIVYDREDRSQLAVAQGKFAEEYFIKPYQNILNEWSAE